MGWNRRIMGSLMLAKTSKIIKSFLLGLTSLQSYQESCSTVGRLWATLEVVWQMLLWTFIDAWWDFCKLSLKLWRGFAQSITKISSCPVQILTTSKQKRANCSSWPSGRALSIWETANSPKNALLRSTLWLLEISTAWLLLTCFECQTPAETL